MTGVLKRFVSKIKASGDCWIWTGSQIKGYPGFTVVNENSSKKRPIYLTSYGHRAAYWLFKGELPKGLVVMHGCDTPLCVNPAHLSLGTIQENNLDSRRKGRDCRGEQSHYAKLNESQVLEIRSRHPKETMTSLANEYNVSTGLISMIYNRKNWKHI